MVAKYAEKVKEKILSIAILVMHALQNYLIINAKKIFLIKIVLFAWKIFFIQENSQLNQKSFFFLLFLNLYLMILRCKH